MDKNKLETFKKRLEERQRELRHAVSRTAQDGRDADLESAQDIADRAANSYNKEFLFHQSNNDRQLLQMVDGALDRIVVPPEVLDRIVGIAPRSSLIVTDETLSSETGRGTDFVVLMSGEPQGGIKIRRRRDPTAEYGYARARQFRQPFGGFFSSW